VLYRIIRIRNKVNDTVNLKHSEVFASPGLNVRNSFEIMISLVIMISSRNNDLTNARQVYK